MKIGEIVKREYSIGFRSIQIESDQLIVSNKTSEYCNHTLLAPVQNSMSHSL